MTDTAVPGISLSLGANDAELQAALSQVLKSAKGYAAGLENALENTKAVESLEDKFEGLTDTIEDEFQETQSIVRRFATKINDTLSMIQLTQLASMVFDFGKELVAVGSEAEDNFARVNAQIKATGMAAGWSADQLAQMASEMSMKTNFEDDDILNAASSLLQFRNIKGDQFREVLGLSTDLAEVMGTDLSSAAEGLARAFEDPGEAMLSLRKAGVILTDEQVKQIKTLKEEGKVREAQAILIEEISKRIKGVAEEMANTSSGGWSRVNKDVGEVYETLGKALLPVLQEVLPHLKDLADYVLALVEPVEDSTSAITGWGETFIGYIKEAWAWAQDFTYTILAGFNTLTLEWGSLVEYFGYGAAYLATKLMNEISYVLLEVLPRYVKWFGSMFVDGMRNTADFLVAVFKNMSANTKEFIAGIKRYMQTGSADFKFTALLEGFKATWEELPELAERGEDDLERKLKQRMDAAGSRVASTFLDQFVQIKEGADKAVKDILDKEDPELKAGPGTAYEHDKGKDAKEKEKTDSKQGDTEGIEDLAKRISAAAARGIDEKQLEEMRKHTELLRELRDTLPDPGDVYKTEVSVDLPGDVVQQDIAVSDQAPRSLESIISGLDNSISTAFNDATISPELATKLDDMLFNSEGINASPENPDDPFNDTGYLPSQGAIDFWDQRGVELDPSVPIPQTPQQLDEANLTGLGDAHLIELRRMNEWLQANGQRQVEAFREGTGKAQ